MPANLVLTHFPTIKAAGAALQPAVANSLIDLEIESTYNRPDLCIMTFDLQPNEAVPTSLDLGTEIEVSFAADGAAVTVFKGEVTALELNGSDQERTVYVVQCEDLMHRLFKVDRTRTFLNSKISDVASKIATENGLSADATATTTTFDYLMQQNVSDGAWLVDQAAKRNLHVRVDDKKLKLKAVGDGGDSTIKVRYGQDLIRFSARATANAHMKEASVRSWDVKQKQVIEGKASSYSGRTDSKVQSANGNYAPTTVLVRTSDVPAAGEAQKIAESVMARANEHNLQAEGTCSGNPKLRVDTEVAVEAVNARFNGKYRISHLRHRYSADEGFMTDFSSRGASDQSISGLVEEAAGSRNRAADRHIFDGVAVAIVTDNKDPDDIGRVKVKFPTLAKTDGGQDNSSDWMRVAYPGAGGSDHHGWYLVPDVDDEVLVVFEQGDARRGYVIGGLHNGKDKPFYKNGDVASAGKVNQRAFRMRNGTHLLFDEKQGSEKIELKNKDGKFLMTITDAEGIKIKNEANGDKFEIDNKGNITVTSQSGDITIEAKSGGINLKATKDITLDAKGKVAIKAAQDATIDGLNVKVNAQAQAEVKGNASATLQASGNTVVKGAIVMIN